MKNKMDKTKEISEEMMNMIIDDMFASIKHHVKTEDQFTEIVYRVVVIFMAGLSSNVGEFELEKSRYNLKTLLGLIKKDTEIVLKHDLTNKK